MKTNTFKFISALLLILTVSFIVGCDKNKPTPTPDPIYTITLDQSSKTLEIGQSFTLTASTLVDGEATTGEVTWTSSAPTVASVTNGLVSALAAGSATITATYQEKTATCVVTVNEAEPEEVFLLLDRSTATMNANSSLSLIASLTDGSTPTITWESSEPLVATVVNGVVTALKSGTTKITASVGELFAECTITVSDVHELIFPEMEKEAYIGDVIDLGVIIKRNGVTVNDEYIVTGQGFDFADGKITITGSKVIEVTVTYKDLPSITRSFTSYTKISTVSDLENIKEDLEGYYKLANDITINGRFNSIAHYSGGHDGNNGFKGVFEGSGYAIKNFQAVYNGVDSANSSLFGYISRSGIVRNLNVINVTIATRIAGGIATVNFGTIENCFVDAYVTYDKTGEANNPIGGIVSKNQGTIDNCIVVLKLKDGIASDNIGGIAGRAYATSNIKNSFAITSVGVFENEAPTLDGTKPNLGAITNSESFATLADFYANSDRSTFNAKWNLQTGLYPTYGSKLQTTVDIQNTETSIYVGTYLQINLLSEYAYRLFVKETIVGVSLSPTGILTVAADVPAGTIITVVLQSLYDASATEELALTVLENSYEAIDVKELYEFNFIKDASSTEAYTSDLIISILYNGAPWEGILTGQAVDPTIANIINGKVVALGDGTTRIAIYASDVLVATITVESTMYLPIYTKAEFEAIATNATTLSKKYKLMNDLNINGTLSTIAHYNAGYQSATNGFSGIFDGNGYSIMNFTSVFTTEAGVVQTGNCSLFGTVAATGIIRNLNVINVTIDKRISGGIATINYGTIENCFVKVYFTFNITTDVNNPMGGIASKNYAIIRNCIVVADVKEGISTVNIGAIAGRTYAPAAAYVGSQIINSYAISALGMFESAIPSGGVNLGSVTNSEVYTDLATFYANSDRTTFNDSWTFMEGKFPHLGTETFVVENTDFEVEQGSSLELIVKSRFGHQLELKVAIEGITLTVNTVTVDETVEVGTEIIIVVKNMYTDLEEEITITVKAVEE